MIATRGLDSIDLEKSAVMAKSIDEDVYPNFVQESSANYRLFRLLNATVDHAAIHHLSSAVDFDDLWQCP